MNHEIVRRQRPDIEPFPASASGQLSHREQLAIDRERARLARELMDYRRNQQAESFARFCFGIGAVFVGFIVLMMAMAILASATKPPAPKPDVCIGLCWGRNSAQ